MGALIRGMQSADLTIAVMQTLHALSMPLVFSLVPHSFTPFNMHLYGC